MNREIPYDPSRDALYRPGEAEDFFAGWSGSEREAALCAEISRLAYCREVEKIARGLSAAGLELAAEPFDRGGTFAFLASGGERSVLAFRGTESDDPTDIIDDARFLPQPWDGMGKVHTGFAEALDRVWSEIGTALEGTTGRLLCTGHSLGAALATLAAARRPGSALFTYGSPRVGDADVAAAMEGRIDVKRYVNCCDLVTRVPPRPYRHVGRRIYIDHDGRIHPELSKARVAADRLEGAGSYLLKLAWRTGNVVSRDLADHAPINYVSALRAES